MTRLILLNGAPGSGKSSLAQRLADDVELTLALDVDMLKHSLGAWESDPVRAGLQARLLALAVAREHMRWGHDVIVGQYLARTEFIEQLAALAASEGCEFVEVVLVLDAKTLGRRLAARAAQPDRTEHHINNGLVGPDDAPQLVASIDTILQLRPRARPVDATDDLTATAQRLRNILQSDRGPS